MHKNVLLTGGSGFVGRNVISYLKDKCNLYTPNRKELNLFSQEDVKNYIIDNKIDIVIHSANPNPVKNVLDKRENMFEESLRMFTNLYNAKDYYEFMYTLGSGAEFGKTAPIISAKEENEFNRVPKDSYGFAKYIMNKMISVSDKHCNLRVFAVYGPTDHESKFITHIINCCMNNEPVTIRQNCVFDYMHVSDLAKIMEFFIYNKPKYYSYNICSGKKIELIDIAKEVIKQMGSSQKIIVLADGMNNEYTASNSRLINEMGGYEFLPIEEGIAIQIESMRSH